MADISLTASMRSNLLSLQQTQDLMDMTQERLSTGKKVNSAIDNPSSYYTAQSLTNRANDLNALLDSMGQGIQTIQAANEGIEAITDFVQQAKAIANLPQPSGPHRSCACGMRSSRTCITRCLHTSFWPITSLNFMRWFKSLPFYCCAVFVIPAFCFLSLMCKTGEW